MAEEPTLPRLLGGLSSRNNSGPAKRAHIRLHSISSPAVSSDPPLFSSDDDPSADNYCGSRKRQKKTFRGPWYNHELETCGTSQKSQRTFQRNFDSGVWLGSDSTDASDVPNMRSGCSGSNPDEHSTDLPILSRRQLHYQPTMAYSQVELVARQIIQDCLEAGKEDVDLTSIGLEGISNDTIRQLATMVSVPVITEGVEFETLKPCLKIFLAANHLQNMPGGIIDLQDTLNVLSIRNNALVDLPAAIGKLHQLVELNFSNNGLRFLPFEILDLLSSPLGPARLTSLQMHPNPFYEPDGLLPLDQVKMAEAGDISIAAILRGVIPNRIILNGQVIVSVWPPPNINRPISARRNHNLGASSPFRKNWELNFKYRSKVRFISMDGTLVAGPSFPGYNSLFVSDAQCKGSDVSDKSIKVLVAPPGDVPTPPAVSRTFGSDRSSRVPSLYEVAVKSWSENPNSLDLDDRYDLCEDYEPPEKLFRLLQDARKLRDCEGGERKCTKCKRAFVIPRTEWIEWWGIQKLSEPILTDIRLVDRGNRDGVESLIPLIRRGCSWKCLPDPVAPEIE